MTRCERRGTTASRGPLGPSAYHLGGGTQLWSLTSVRLERAGDGSGLAGLERCAAVTPPPPPVCLRAFCGPPPASPRPSLHAHGKLTEVACPCPAAHRRAHYFLARTHKFLFSPVHAGRSQVRVPYPSPTRRPRRSVSRSGRRISRRKPRIVRDRRGGPRRRGGDALVGGGDVVAARCRCPGGCVADREGRCQTGFGPVWAGPGAAQAVWLRAPRRDQHRATTALACSAAHLLAAMGLFGPWQPPG